MLVQVDTTEWTLTCCGSETKFVSVQVEDTPGTTMVRAYVHLQENSIADAEQRLSAATTQALSQSVPSWPLRTAFVHCHSRTYLPIVVLADSQRHMHHLF